MRRVTANAFVGWVKRVEENTLFAPRFRIGSRLILCFLFIILSMLVGDAVVLWQFQRVRSQAERLNGVDQKLVAVLRLHMSLVAFHDGLQELTDSEDAGRVEQEAEPLRSAVLEDTQRAISALTLQPFDVQRDPTLLPALQVIQNTLPSQLDAVTSLASMGDWRAVRARLTNQIQPLESQTSALVMRVDDEVGHEQAQTALDAKRVQQRLVLFVLITAVFTLLVSATLGLAVTRNIVRPLERLVEGSRALARGDFQHQVAVRGDDELAHLARVFNDTARQLRDLYATLRSSEKQLRDLIEEIPVMALSLRPDGSTEFVNRRMLDYTGLSAETISASGWESTIHKDDLENHVNRWRASLACGEPFENELRHRSAAGEYRWFLVRAVPLLAEDGNVLKWYGILTDIEDRKRAEEALRRSEAYLVEAQKLSHVGSWAVNFNTRQVLYSSDEHIRLYGFDPGDGMPTYDDYYSRVPPKEESAGTAVLERAIHAGEDYDFEAPIILPDGTVKYLRTIGHPNPFGAPGEYTGITIDVTERKRAEAEREKLRQLQADLAHVNRFSVLGELAASLSHELKQPIAAAITNARVCLRWLMRDEPQVQEAREAASRIVHDGKRAAEIIDHLRSFYIKGAPPEREFVDVNEVVREMLGLLRGEANRYSISMCTNLAPEIPGVRADRVQLQQVLMNLMLNAIEAMKDTRGQLTISSSLAQDDYLLISVSDTGIGLPTAKPDEIFSAFFTTKPQGSGMGLAISRSIVESHGGRLWATANSGPGAAFHFTLPAQAKSAHATAI